MFGLWVGFMGLAGAMALLFWMVLHFSVENKYQEQTENDLRMASQSIWDMYGDEDLETNIAFLAKSNDYFVQIVSENPMQVVLSVNNQGETAAPQQADIADETLFERLNDSDGICQYYVDDPVHASRWAVQAVVLANLNGSRQVLVVSRSQANVDALMKLLNSRYLLVTVIVLILASILSCLLYTSIAVIIGILLFFAGVQRSVEKNSQRTMMNNVTRQSEHLRTILSIHYEYLNELANQMGQKEELFCQENIDQLTSIYESTDLDRVALIQPDGTAYYDNGQVKNVSHRRYFQEAISGRQTLSDPLELSLIHILISCPRRKEF